MARVSGSNYTSIVGIGYLKVFYNIRSTENLLPFPGKLGICVLRDKRYERKKRHRLES